MIGRVQFQSGFDVAFQIGAEPFDLREPLVLPAHHPEAAPGLIGRAAGAGVEGDLLDMRAELAQSGCGVAANRIDLRLHADAGNVGHIGDAQALDVLAPFEARPARFAMAAPPRSAKYG